MSSLFCYSAIRGQSVQSGCSHPNADPRLHPRNIPPPKMREFATTSQAILHHATERPHDDAIVEYGSRISYRKVAHSIVQFTAALQDLGVAPGELVVIRVDTRFIHWMI